MIKYLFILLLLFSTLSCENNSIEKAKAFGAKEFVSSEWKSSDINTKSEMIYSFLKKHDVSNMYSNDIHQLLGDSTAYYEYDEFPAYNIILNGNEYVIAFPINRKTNKIRKHVFEPKLK
jgi:hypothetical protein